jgi:hypothetical protein
VPRRAGTAADLSSGVGVRVTMKDAIHPKLQASLLDCITFATHWADSPTKTKDFDCSACFKFFLKKIYK